MLKISWAWAQYFAGTGTNLLEDTLNTMDHVPAKWIMSLRAFLHRINATISIYNPEIYPMQRHGDQHLMDVAYQCGQFTAKEIESINYCRLYLNVFTISDIADPSGEYIQSAAKSGLKQQLLSTSKWIGPVQIKPDYHAWRLWQKLLLHFSYFSRRLHTRLGPWLHDAAHLDREWTSYRHREGDWHYVRQVGNSEQWLILQREGATWVKTGLTKHLLKVDLFPCHLDDEFTTSLLHAPVPPLINSISDTFETYLCQQPQETRHFLHHVELFKTPDQIMQACNLSDVAVLATDGSSLPRKMAYGWVLAHPYAGHLAEGAGPAYGQSTSHRAEGHGVHAGMLFLHLLSAFSKKSITKLKIICDNQGVISKATSRQGFKIPFPNYALTADWDQLESAHSIIQQLSVSVKFEHIKGHQDEKESRLSFEASLNVRADYLAGQHIYQDISPKVTTPVTAISQCHLHIYDRTITSNYKEEIRDAATAAPLRQKILNRCSISSEQFSFVDWSLFSASNSRQKHLRVWKAKFVHNLLPTVTKDHTYTYNRPKCQHCETSTDHWLHTLVCPHPSRREPIRQFVADLDAFLVKQQTCPELRQAIHLGLRSWVGLCSQEQASDNDICVLQEKIGWANFLKGLWHIDLCQIQHEYLHETHKRSISNTGTLWALNVLDFVWHAMHVLWKDHTSSIHNPAQGMPARQVRLIRQITELQEDYEKICPHMSQHFIIPSSQLPFMLISRLVTWLRMHEPVIQKAVKLQKHANSIQQHLITKFFPAPLH